jgi:threonine synthase
VRPSGGPGGHDRQPGLHAPGHHLAEHYEAVAGRQRVHVVQVTEQAIMDWHAAANRNGHIACTHGGECLAGLHSALAQGAVEKSETAVIDSTAHALKFAGFQELYFENRFPEELWCGPTRT